MRDPLKNYEAVTKMRSSSVRNLRSDSKPATEGGGPAFPFEQGHTPDGLRNPTFEPGMTLRDYFAAKALNALILSQPTNTGYIFSHAAYDAYVIADSMLNVREKP